MIVDPMYYEFTKKDADFISEIGVLAEATKEQPCYVKLDLPV